MKESTRKKLEGIAAKFDISVELVESVVDLYMEIAWHDISESGERPEDERHTVCVSTKNGCKGWAYTEDLEPKRYNE
jgi:adenine C2-methylase RlmN of 23S rRNA A2503 and tRNA A37